MNHPDLVDNINQKLSIDFTVDIPGRPDYRSKNIYSHGSHVAGTIAAANSKFRRVLAPESIVSRPPSTNRVHTSDLVSYTHSRWLWSDWSSSRRRACLVSIPKRTMDPACTCLQPQLTICFISAVPSLILYRIKVLDEVRGGQGKTYGILRGIHYAGNMYVKYGNSQTYSSFIALFITSPGQPLTTCYFFFLFLWPSSLVDAM
jgi:subtilisin family serine protease